MPTAVHINIYIIHGSHYPSRTLSCTYTRENIAHKPQYKFWPYTPPDREYAADTQATYGYCAQAYRTRARTSESAGESDSGAHDVVFGIRTRLQVNSDVSDKLAVWLPRDDLVSTFPICGPGTVDCTRRASLGDGDKHVDEGKRVVFRKPQKRGSVAVTHPGVFAICPQLLYNPPLPFVHQL
jgi:hypothetical protein